MKATIPSSGNFRAIAKEYGFIAGPATDHGKRPAHIKASVIARRGRTDVELKDFGWLAGRNVSHVNIGLLSCTQIALFDPNNKVGASSHFEIGHLPNPSAPLQADLEKDLNSMIRALI